jgi:hypothetical protein
MSDEDSELDELLGRTRCARCGQVLHGEIECPFCSVFPEPSHAHRLPTWVFFTACFLTSPLSLPVILSTNRLTAAQKLLAASGMIGWFGIWWI